MAFFLRSLACWMGWMIAVVIVWAIYEDYTSLGAMILQELPIMVGTSAMIAMWSVSSDDSIPTSRTPRR